MKRRRRRASNALLFDPALGDPEIRGALYAGYNRNWGDLQSSVLESDQMWLIMQVLSGPFGLPVDTLEEWVAHEWTGHSASLWAMARVDHAWSQRTISDGSAQLSGTDFVRELAEAETILRQVVEAAPDLAEPWAYLAAIARGRELGRDELRARFTEAHNRHPFHPDACSQFLLGSSTWWADHGGSLDDMFEFTRWVDATAPADAPAHHVLPRMHLERGYRNPGEQTATEYLGQPDVIDELARGLERFLEATPSPAESVHLATLNHYALTLAPVNRHTADLVDECFQRIGDRATIAPWNLFGTVWDRFDQVRTRRLADAAHYLQ